ncbi:hypothetical protein GUJ93_ZPchr0001g30069 [Zizania palustris]|uniref:Uncharacterized protein n=1 Tax=Zizania palustris TaxID=103762 RepID=A0A8J5SBU1_ZIZPA|nr:hypothetical protein GUJ93_ZPchr0001g30069 [Zizania palustris]
MTMVLRGLAALGEDVGHCGSSAVVLPVGVGWSESPSIVVMEVEDEFVLHRGWGEEKGSGWAGSGSGSGILIEVPHQRRFLQRRQRLCNGGSVYEARSPSFPSRSRRWLGGRRPVGRSKAAATVAGRSVEGGGQAVRR